MNKNKLAKLVENIINNKNIKTIALSCATSLILSTNSFADPELDITNPTDQTVKTENMKTETTKTDITNNNQPTDQTVKTETPKQPIDITIPKETKTDQNGVTTQIAADKSMNEISHINIQAKNNITKITIDLSKNIEKDNKQPVITQDGNVLSIELPDTNIPEILQRTIQTDSFGTVVQHVDLTKQKTTGKITVFQNDLWGYSVSQHDKQIIIEINPIIKGPNKEEYKGESLTLNFQNMDVRAIIQVIADFTGLNIMTSDSVQGAMSIRLKDVPWDQALDLVLEAKNLQKQKSGNVIWIATKQEIVDKNKAQLEINEQTADLEPLKIEFFQIDHYKATEMKNIIEGKYPQAQGAGGGGGGAASKATPSLLSKRGSVGLDIRNNMIFVQDTQQKLDEIKRIVHKIDIPSKQVLIEAKLVIVTDNFELDMGSRFGLAFRGNKGKTSVGVSNSATDSTTIAQNGANSANVTDFGWNQPIQNPGGSIGFTILNSATGAMLNAELDSLETTQKGKVISNPRLLTENNKKAEIRQGTEIPYVTPGMLNMPATVSFKDAVLSLGVTPQVSPNGRITMELDITKDTVGQLVNVQGGGQVPSIDTRKITTEVTINDGQTVILGGIYEVTKAADLYKVPFFADIPWLGNLFKNSVDSKQKVELLIFITPHIINDSDLDAINQKEQTTLHETDINATLQNRTNTVK